MTSGRAGSMGSTEPVLKLDTSPEVLFFHIITNRYAWANIVQSFEGHTDQFNHIRYADGGHGIMRPDPLETFPCEKGSTAGHAKELSPVYADNVWRTIGRNQVADCRFG